MASEAEFQAGDKVVFRQKSLDDNSEWQYHQGRVQETNVNEYGDLDSNAVGFDRDEKMALVNWDDGETTRTQFEKLNHPEDVAWYPFPDN